MNDMKAWQIEVELAEGADRGKRLIFRTNTILYYREA